MYEPKNSPYDDMMEIEASVGRWLGRILAIVVFVGVLAFAYVRS